MAEQLPNKVYRVVGQVVEERSGRVAAVRDDCRLVDDLGLKSLDLARIVAKLDLSLHVNPFSTRVAITSVRTVGDLCAAYRLCLSESERSEDEQAAETSGPAR